MKDDLIKCEGCRSYLRMKTAIIFIWFLLSFLGFILFIFAALIAPPTKIEVYFALCLGMSVVGSFISFIKQI